MICSDWVHINHHEKAILPGMRLSGQASPEEVHIRSADTKCEGSEQKWGPGARPRKKFCDHTLQIVGKCSLFVKKSPLKEAVELD